MAVKRVDPQEAAKLLEEGWRYVDVRSIPEFEQGHPAGALNIPLMHFVPGRGMSPNPDFVRVFTAHVGVDDKVVVGCRSGQRSLRAAEMMTAQGYKNLVDMKGGFEGEQDRGGRLAVPGWRPSGLPVATEAAPGHAYRDLEGGKGK